MTQANIQRIVIVGGGTAGWMAAASLANFVSEPTRIQLVESPDIGTVGVGEATVPGIRDFNASLGIDEIDFIKKTGATFKLAIEFVDWRNVGHSFFHPFSGYGAPLWGVDFHQCWRKSLDLGNPHPVSDYCLPIAMCKEGKFAQPHPDPKNPLADYKYAFHFDASLYAVYLRDYAMQRGVEHIQDVVRDVTQNTTTGFIESVSLQTGRVLAGDLFIDCTGFRGLLIQETLKTGYEDWSRWLPTDRAVAVQTEANTPPPPYTVSTAREEGWQWRIPLQHRVGNGYVFCSQLIDDDAATSKLLQSVDGRPLNDARVIKFATGRRKKFWNKNCVALGLAAGFLEPLESTSISLIQTGLSKLLTFFPNEGFITAEVDEANRLAQLEFERIRDFLILHYHLTNRVDSELWRQSAAMDIPDPLRHKIALYKSRGHIVNYEMESFRDASWVSMYCGFGVHANHVEPKASTLPDQELVQQLEKIRSLTQAAGSRPVSHEAFIRRHCTAPRSE